MPSRNPASDEFSDVRLPDLPSDFFGEEESSYPPPRRRSPHQERRRFAQQEDTGREGRPRRQSRVAENVLEDQRPQRAPQRPGTQRRNRYPEERPQRRERRPQRSSRQDRVVEQPRMQMQSATADIVTNVRPVRSERPARAKRRRNPAWSWKPIVMPQPRQIFVQAWPYLLMAFTAMLVLLSIAYLPFGLPVWAPLLMSTSVALYVMADARVHPMWPRAAVVNLATVGAFFPLIIVRQSALRVPFVEWGNGTLFMPIISTIIVVFVLGMLALISAILSEEDPEYAGILFLPAALLMPFFVGATEITSLTTALAILAAVYLASSILTVVASMLPGAYPTLVAPIALALVFLILPLSENSDIFPLGAGMFAKLLFFIVISAAVGLTVAVPVISVWTHRVRRLVESGHIGEGRSFAA